MLFFSGGVASGKITPNDFVRMLSTNPAKLMGMYPVKGTLRIGADADVVLWDPAANWTLKQEMLHMGTDYSPFDRMSLQGRPVLTMIRGEIIVENNRFVGNGFKGKMVRRNTPELI